MATGSFGTSLGFAGELQTETEFVYLRARHYDPGRGRFPQRRRRYVAELSRSIVTAAWLKCYPSHVDVPVPRGPNRKKVFRGGASNRGNVAPGYHVVKNEVNITTCLLGMRRADLGTPVRAETNQV